MSYIDLRYIAAKNFTQQLANCNNLNDLRSAIEYQIQNDLQHAQTYIDKYDNNVDRSEGTDVFPLKAELQRIKDLLNKLKEL